MQFKFVFTLIYIFIMRGRRQADPEAEPKRKAKQAADDCQNYNLFLNVVGCICDLSRKYVNTPRAEISA